MGASYTYKTYLKSRNNNANTTFYLKVIVTETSLLANIPTTYSYKIILGLDSKHYHYRLNNYVWATWKDSGLVGSSDEQYETPIVIGTCGGTSGNPVCNMTGHGNGYQGNSEQELYSGSFTSNDGSSGVLSVTFEQRMAVPDNNSNDYDFYSATITQTITPAKGMSVYNGSAWKSGPVYVYNGSEWKPAKRVWVYNGSSWV